MNKDNNQRILRLQVSRCTRIKIDEGLTSPLILAFGTCRSNTWTRERTLELIPVAGNDVGRKKYKEGKEKWSGCVVSYFSDKRCSAIYASFEKYQCPTLDPAFAFIAREMEREREREIYRRLSRLFYVTSCHAKTVDVPSGK